MKPSTYVETLSYINAFRAHDGKEPLAFIPSGIARDAKRCPLGRAGVPQNTPKVNKFISEFDAGASDLGEVDPWVLIEGSITMKTLEKIEDAPEGHSVLEEMDAQGDTKHSWDPKNKDEVELARELFGTLTTRGMQVFRIRPGGSAGERMTKFDPKAARMIAVPQLQGG